MRFAMVVAAAVAVMVVAAVVVLLVVEESHGTILGLKIARFRRFLKRRNGHTDIRTDGRTDRPSYRDARTHLKSHLVEFPIFLDLVAAATEGIGSGGGLSGGGVGSKKWQSSATYAFSSVINSFFLFLSLSQQTS